MNKLPTKILKYILVKLIGFLSSILSTLIHWFFLCWFSFSSNHERVPMTIEYRITISHCIIKQMTQAWNHSNQIAKHHRGPFQYLDSSNIFFIVDLSRRWDRQRFLELAVGSFFCWFAFFRLRPSRACGGWSLLWVCRWVRQVVSSVGLPSSKKAGQSLRRWFHTRIVPTKTTSDSFSPFHTRIVFSIASKIVFSISVDMKDHSKANPFNFSVDTDFDFQLLLFHPETNKFIDFKSLLYTKK